MSRDQSEYHVGIGASSVLMILVVLALTAVSLLALSSARNTAALTERSQRMTVDYYTAASDAQLRLMEADQWLLAAREDATDEATYQLALDATLPAGFTRTETGFAFEVDAGDGRVLAVEANLAPYDQSDARYAVIRHQLVGAPAEDGSSHYTLIGE